jgi:hypothetical protein
MCARLACTEYLDILLNVLRVCIAFKQPFIEYLANSHKLFPKIGNSIVINVLLHRFHAYPTTRTLFVWVFSKRGCCCRIKNVL